MIYKKIKQIFCKHNWVIVDSYRFSERYQDGTKRECFSAIQKCTKCNKVKDIFVHS